MQRIASLLAIALLAGCAGAAPSSPQAPSSEDANVHEAATQTVTLGVGERATLADGSQLTYLRLVNDSRCPPDVQCVWAGDAEIRLRVQPKRGAASELSLHTSPLRGQGQTEATVGGLRIALQSLERGIAPKATLTITATAP